MSFINSPQEFEKLLNFAGGVIVHFSANWAPQCSQVQDVLNELKTRYKNIKFAQVESEELVDISKKYNVTSIPLCILFQAGKEVSRINGVNPGELVKKLENLSSQNPSGDFSKDSKPEDLNNRLKKLINSSYVMVFMKGSPDNPCCGFSKTLVELLRKEKINFKSFDILKDEEVRQGLKKYSDWPTYPQVYVKGELVGGLDIVKEMVENKQFTGAGSSLEEKLKWLINQQHIMIFMKGNSQNPKCGFSKTLIEIINSKNVEYGTFDILEDEEVRQGLKTYSNWPTYPQLYVAGELIGGLDIIKELNSSGEFDKTLKK